MKEFDQFLINVVYNVPNFIFVVDPIDTKIVYANQYMKDKFGHDCVGKSFAEQFNAAGGAYFFVSYKRHDTHNKVSAAVEFANQAEYYHDDSENWYHVQQRQVEWIDGTHKIVCVLNEINVLKRFQNDLSEAHAMLALKNRELAIAAKTDLLTQISNRRCISEVIECEFARCQRSGTLFSILMIDCDNFKIVNDSHGHLVGDLVLIDIARLLSISVRATDIVGRWGGEEFLVILPETNLAGAIQIAEKLRQIIASHNFQVVGHKTTSFGVVELKKHENVDELIARADKALYHAKANGRNRVEAIE